MGCEIRLDTTKSHDEIFGVRTKDSKNNSVCVLKGSLLKLTLLESGCDDFNIFIFFDVGRVV